MNKFFVLFLLGFLGATEASGMVPVCERSRPMKYALEAKLRKGCRSISSHDLLTIKELRVTYEDIDILPGDFEGLWSQDLRVKIETTAASVNARAFEGLRNHKIYGLYLSGWNVLKLEKRTFSELQVNALAMELHSLESDGPLFSGSKFEAVNLTAAKGGPTGKDMFGGMEVGKLKVMVFEGARVLTEFTPELFAGSTVREASFRLANAPEKESLLIHSGAFKDTGIEKLQITTFGQMKVDRDALPPSLKEFYYEGAYLFCPEGCFSAEAALDRVTIESYGLKSGPFEGSPSTPFLGTQLVKEAEIALGKDTNPDFLLGLDVDRLTLGGAILLAEAKAVRSMIIPHLSNLADAQSKATQDHLQELQIQEASSPILDGSFSFFRKLKTLTISAKYLRWLYLAVSRANDESALAKYKDMMQSESLEKISVQNELDNNEPLEAIALWLENSRFPNIQKLEMVVPNPRDWEDAKDQPYPKIYELLKDFPREELDLTVQLYSPKFRADIQSRFGLGWLGGLQKLNANNLRVEYKGSTYSLSDVFAIDEDIRRIKRLSILLKSYNYGYYHGNYNEAEARKSMEEDAGRAAQKAEALLGKKIEYSTSWGSVRMSGTVENCGWDFQFN